MIGINLEVKRRLVVILIGTFVLFFALSLRLGWIQLVKGEEYKLMALEQWTKDIPISPRRGIIYDRNGKELAISASNDTVWVRPADIKSPREAAEKLAPILEMEVESLEDIFSRKTSLLVVKRWISKEQSDSVRKLGIKGVEVVEDNKRYYPKGNFASYILGHTTIDSQGQYGVEQMYDKYLTGVRGRKVIITDAKQRELHQAIEKYYEPQDGYGIVLTIDEVIQHYAENAIRAAVEKNLAKRGIVLAMHPKTGEILAMAVSPDYDPNTPRNGVDQELNSLLDKLRAEQDIDRLTQELNKMWRNPIISDVYEPGSTFKIITTVAGLEEGVVTPQSTFSCNGHVLVGGHRLKCWRYYRPHGAQTLVTGVHDSCNPVFIEISKRLQTQTFLKYIEAFGFRTTTGIDLPGETSGIVRRAEQVGPVELATMSYGQGVSVTPLQLLTAISAVANGGNLMEPRIVKEITDPKGQVIKSNDPTIIRQVVSKETSDIMNYILETTVSEGGGKNAYVPGFRIAGKTGTANKVIGGGYGQGKYIASFAGYAPADNPQVALLVIIDEPGGDMYYGGTIAAPVAGQLFKEILTYLEVEPKYTEEERDKFIKKEVEVPDITSMDLNSAISLLTKLKLKYISEETSEETNVPVIKEQFPKAGTKVQEGQIVYLYFKQN